MPKPWERIQVRDTVTCVDALGCVLEVDRQDVMNNRTHYVSRGWLVGVDPNDSGVRTIVANRRMLAAAPEDARAIRAEMRRGREPASAGWPTKFGSLVDQRQALYDAVRVARSLGNVGAAMHLAFRRVLSWLGPVGVAVELAFDDPQMRRFAALEVDE
jgi:hypothetical protein